MNTINLSQETEQEALDQAVATLQAGGLIIYPTETCYGVGVDATNQDAVNKLLAYKGKRNDKAISVVVTDKEMAEEYVDVNKTAENIFDNFLPGPITVVSKGKHKLADKVESSMGTQGIRIPDYEFVRKLAKAYGKPFTATSANASYKKTPYAIQDILDNTTKKQQDLIDLVLDAGTLPKRKPSTVVDTTLDNIHILREGGITFENKKIKMVRSLEETETFVGELYNQIKKHVGKKTIVFLLQGDLGAGKTHMTKFLAKHLGVEKVVVSPTYTICKEYKGKDVTLQHMDTYRLYEPEELDDLRPEQMFKSPNVVVIEWANKVLDHITPYLEKAVVVKANIKATGETSRTIEYEVE